MSQGNKKITTRKIPSTNNKVLVCTGSLRFSQEIPTTNYKITGTGTRDSSLLKRSGISNGDQEKIVWNFQGSWLLALEFPGDLTQFCGISRGGALFCIQFPRGK